MYACHTLPMRYCVNYCIWKASSPMGTLDTDATSNLYAGSVHCAVRLITWRGAPRGGTGQETPGGARTPALPAHERPIQPVLVELTRQAVAASDWCTRPVRPLTGAGSWSPEAAHACLPPPGPLSRVPEPSPSGASSPSSSAPARLGRGHGNVEVRSGSAGRGANDRFGNDLR